MTQRKTVGKYEVMDGAAEVEKSVMLDWRLGMR